MSVTPSNAASEGGLRSAEVVDGDLFVILNNTMDAIEACRLEVLRYVEPLDLSEMVINRLEVVLEELIANIVRHGFDAGSDQSILIALSTQTGDIELVIEDDGRPFNMLEAPVRAPYESIDTAEVGGLGIPLVRKMTRSIAYESGGGAPDEPVNRLIVILAT
jgi:serine/threonine-protein kinase RsbW